MCNFYSARKFRLLCGLSVVLGLLAWILSTIGVSTNRWLVAEVTNSTTRVLYRIITGMWDLCTEEYYVKENDDIGALRASSCFNIEFFISNMVGDESVLSYYKSLMAFELISVLAVFIGTVIATVALVQQHPLVVLVAGFTMLFSGLFMIVGHIMFLSLYINEEEEEAGGTLEGGADEKVDDLRVYLGWSFLFAWCAFALCIISGAVLLELYRVCRNYMDEYGNHNPPRIKKRSRPVHVGSTI